LWLGREKEDGMVAYRPVLLATCAATLLLGTALVGYTTYEEQDVNTGSTQLLQENLLLFKMAPPAEPWDPPSNLYMFWGSSPNKR
jgi:hypothetical protein